MLTPSDKTNDLLTGRKLPEELRKRFDASGISSSEQKDFLGLLESTAPSAEELADIATTKNPWAKLAELLADKEAPEREARRDTIRREIHAKLGKIDEDYDLVVEPQRELKPAPTPKAKPPVRTPVLCEEKLPQRTSADELGESFARGVARYSEDEVRNYLNSLRLYYSLDLPGKDPEVVLEEPNRSIYKLLIEALQKFDSLRKTS